MRDTLLRPELYRRIDAGHALDTMALYRLHVAVLHRALHGPRSVEQGTEWYLNGFPVEPIEQYLEEHGHRFDLFGDEPFMQVAGLDPAQVGENFRSHWTRLSTDEGSPNTTALFNVEARPGGDRSDLLTPAQAARRLVAHQAFTLGGLIKRFTTAARAAPVATAALFLAEGSNLHQTLALNLTTYPESMERGDLPVWEEPQLTVTEIQRKYADKEPLTKPAAGYVSRYTWPSRSVLLLPEDTPGGVRVRSVGFGAGVPLDGAGEGSGRNIDPMVSLLPSRDEKGEPYAYKLRRDRLLWRDLTSLLPGAADTVAVDRKDNLKVKPGRVPETLLHAAAVMRLAQEKSAPGAPTAPLSQDAAEEMDEGTADARAAHPVVPMLVFGQLTDQGKAFAIRQETYTLPEAFIQNPADFHDYVKQALTDATTVGSALRGSVSLLALELLKKDGARSPDPADVRKLAEQIPAVPTYWQALETPFRIFLRELDGEKVAAVQRWHGALRRSALAGWALAEEAAGQNGHGLRAVQKAQAPLLKAFDPLIDRPAAPQRSA